MYVTYVYVMYSRYMLECFPIPVHFGVQPAHFELLLYRFCTEEAEEVGALVREVEKRGT